MSEFSTEYEVGDVFYFPRSFEIQGEIQKTDDEGRVWRSTETTFEPRVTAKKVDRISIDVSKRGTRIMYRLVNVDLELLGARIIGAFYSEKDLELHTFRTHEEAMSRAVELASKRVSHYGPEPDNSSW